MCFQDSLTSVCICVLHLKAQGQNSPTVSKSLNLVLDGCGAELCPYSSGRWVEDMKNDQATAL